MKDKLLWSAIVMLALVLAVSHAQASAQVASPIGRFQVVAAPSDSTYGVQVYRVDTVTGKTWIQAVVPQGQAKKLVWALMPEPEQ